MLPGFTEALTKTNFFLIVINHPFTCSIDLTFVYTVSWRHPGVRAAPPAVLLSVRDAFNVERSSNLSCPFRIFLIPAAAVGLEPTGETWIFKMWSYCSTVSPVNRSNALFCYIQNKMDLQNIWLNDGINEPEVFNQLTWRHLTWNELNRLQWTHRSFKHKPDNVRKEFRSWNGLIFKKTTARPLQFEYLFTSRNVRF